MTGILCGSALLLWLMRVCDRATVSDALRVCVYTPRFPRLYMWLQCQQYNAKQRAKQCKWMCRRLISGRMRASMSECVILCVKMCRKNARVCLCLKWVMNCHVSEWKAIHHPHQWLWGPVITCFPSFTLLMAISLDQTLGCADSHTLKFSFSNLQSNALQYYISKWMHCRS